MTGSKLILPFFLLSLLIFSCDEQLPPRVDPAHLFQHTIDALYVLTPTENELEIFITLKNLYDETLDDTAFISGSVRIVHAEDTSIHVTAPLSDLNLISARHYNRITGELQIDPGDSIVFRYTWNFIDDYGRDLRDSLFHYVADTTCQFRSLAAEEPFILTSRLVIFRKTSVVVSGPTRYGLCHVSRYVSPRECVPIRTDLPCSER